MTYKAVRDVIERAYQRGSAGHDDFVALDKAVGPTAGTEETNLIRFFVQDLQRGHDSRGRQIAPTADGVVYANIRMKEALGLLDKYPSKMAPPGQSGMGGLEQPVMNQMYRGAVQGAERTGYRLLGTAGCGAIGAGIGVWFGGVGAIPGWAIGAGIGAVIGWFVTPEIVEPIMAINNVKEALGGSTSANGEPKLTGGDLD